MIKPYRTKIKGSIFNRENDTEEQIEIARNVAATLKKHEACAIIAICRLAAHLEGGNLEGKIPVSVTADMVRITYALEEDGFEMDDIDCKIMSDIIRCLGITKDVVITKSGIKFQNDMLEEEKNRNRLN